MFYEARMNAATALSALVKGSAHFQDVTLDRLQASVLELEQRLHRQVGPQPIAEICADLFQAGGKRLRPLAALASAEAVGVASEPALKIAEMAEATHGAALLHDDVIDEADTRRGKVTARRRWNNTLSILSGDFLLVRTLRLVASLGSDDVVQYHLDTLEDLLASEADQHVAKRTGDLTIENYLSIAEGKTGSLFGFACGAPPLLLGDKESAKLLDNYGRQMGIAFQIADDVRDVLFLDPTKPAALDLTDGIASLPIRCAAQKDELVKKFMSRASEKLPNAEEVAEVTRRILQTEAIDQSIKMGLDYLQRATDSLDALTGSERFTTHRAVCSWLQGELLRQKTAVSQ